METKTTQENSEACAGLAAANGSPLPTCAYCGKAMIFNVPRMGAAGGFVHAGTHTWECEKAGSPETCKERNHDISKHFQQVRDEVEATCRCFTCGRNWQEFYRLDRTE